MSLVHLQYALPKRLMTEAAGAFARARCGALTTFAIRRFIRRYGVAMDEALQPDPTAYPTFNDFFTRALRADARPLAATEFLCPVDGAISQLGAIEAGEIVQAKGRRYTVAELLGADAAAADSFRDGSFATLYLSPKDYHRIHMPCAGTLRRMVHVPGDLFSVNPATARAVPRLFARNERVVCHFDGEHGPFVLVLVGATIVGSIATVWHGVVTPPRRSAPLRLDYPADGEQAVTLARGAEMGRFLLGSTVVLLWPRGVIEWNGAWQPGGSIRMGEAMGRFAAAPDARSEQA